MFDDWMVNFFLIHLALGWCQRMIRWCFVSVLQSLSPPCTGGKGRKPQETGLENSASSEHVPIWTIVSTCKCLPHIQTDIQIPKENQPRHPPSEESAHHLLVPLRSSSLGTNQTLSAQPDAITEYFDLLNYVLLFIQPESETLIRLPWSPHFHWNIHNDTLHSHVSCTARRSFLRKFPNKIARLIMKSWHIHRLRSSLIILNPLLIHVTLPEFAANFVHVGERQGRDPQCPGEWKKNVLFWGSAKKRSKHNCYCSIFFGVCIYSALDMEVTWST